MRTGIAGLALAFLAASTAGVLAQETTGTITGRVVDPQGLVVPGVTITVIGQQAPHVVVSDGNGRFTALFLTPGTYTVRAEVYGHYGTFIGDLFNLFNLFNQKTVLDYDNFTESTFASPNPNVGQPRSLADGPAIQAPFEIRLGVRYSF